MALPTGIFNIFYQPQDVEYYITLDPTSRFQPTIDVLVPGAKNQQWQVSGDQSSNLRSICSVSSGVCIGRSAVDINDTLTEPTPIPWYMASTTFGPGWYKFSANPNDAGPWWVVGIDTLSGSPQSIVLDSAGWNIFFFRPVQPDVTSASGLPSFTSSTSATITPTTSANLSGTGISTATNVSTSGTTTSTSSLVPSSVSSGSNGTSSAKAATSTNDNPNGLSQGDIASLASSIPIGILGLVVGALGVYYARKQQRAGRPVLNTFKKDVASLFQRHTPH